MDRDRIGVGTSMKKFFHLLIDLAYDLKVILWSAHFPDLSRLSPQMADLT